jgi:hypothetical protein
MSICRGALNTSAVLSIQLSTLFLIVNRIQAIIFPSVAVTRYRYWCQYASLLIFSTNFFGIFALVFRRAYSPKQADGTGEFFGFNKIFICLEIVV